MLARRHLATPKPTRRASPLVPAGSADVAVVTEGMGARIAPGQDALSGYRRRFMWGRCRQLGDKPPTPVGSTDPNGVERLVVPGAYLLRHRIADPDQPRFIPPTGLIEGLEHFVGQEQQYGGHVYRYT